MSIFKGSAVALVTPFTNDGVNYKALEKLLNFHLENGTAGIVACGTTGEPSTMTKEEKRGVIKFCVDHIAGRIPVIAGTGGNNTAEVIEESVYAESVGADALLVVTPYYNKCSQRGIIKHYTMVGDAVNIPIIVYNVPSRTGLNVLPETMAKLAAHKNIQAVKEASGDISQIVKMARLLEGKMDMYSGNDDQVIPLMSVGGIGVISVIANVMPKETNEMAQAFLAGDVQKAAKLQRDLLPLNYAMFSDVNPIPAKMALNMMGFEAGPLRMPLCEMDEAGAQNIRKTLQSYGLIKE